MRVGYRERKRQYDGVLSHALRYHTEFEQFLLLFYNPRQPVEQSHCGTSYCTSCTPDPIELMNGSAKHFFGMLYYAQVDRTIINVCRLMDPQFQGKGRHRNLSFHALHDCSEYLPKYPAEATILINRMNSLAGTVRDWRDKHAAHLSYDETLGTKKLRSHFVPAVIQNFYKDVVKFLDLVGRALFDAPYDPITSVPFGVEEMMRTIRDGVALRNILDLKATLYEDLYHGRLKKFI